ncbi:MAG TPA: DMT family transporter [Acidimicrobiia bacterium]|nr:DMT family transporter [Acidimicrobiia bacterium]
MSRRPFISTAPGTSAGAFGLAEWGLLGAVALMWGSSFLWIAEGVEAFAPPVVTLGRLVLGAAALSLFPKTRRPVPRSDWAPIVILGLLWMTIPLLLFPIAQDRGVDSAVAGMINGGTPLFAAVVAWALLRRPPGLLQAAGLAVGFTGVILVTVPSATGSNDPLGVVLILIATALYGLAFNISVPLVQRHGSLPVLLRAQVVAIVASTPLGIAGLGSSEWAWSSAAAMLVLGVFSTGVAYVAMATLGARVGATRGSIGVYFLPIVAVVLGVVFRDESVAPLSIVGMVLVGVGAWLASRREA